MIHPRRPGRAGTVAFATLAALAVGPFSGCGADGPAPEAGTSSTTGSAPTGEPSDDQTGAGSEESVDVTLVQEVSDAGEPEVPRNASRARVVDLDTDALLDESGAPIEQVSVSLDLFEDAAYTTELTYSDDAGFDQWAGELDGVDLSTVVLVKTGEVFQLAVNSPEGVYSATPADGHYLLTQVDPDAELPER